MAAQNTDNTTKKISNVWSSTLMVDLNVVCLQLPITGVFLSIYCRVEEVFSSVIKQNAPFKIMFKKYMISYIVKE